MTSVYCFDAKLFDADYFREMMRQSRERRKLKSERLRRLLAESRSSPLTYAEKPSLDGLEGLENVLDEWIGTRIPLETFLNISDRPPFEMDRYRRHILELVTGCIVRFDGVSRLIDDIRLDRIYRFIAVVFMQHNGEIMLQQTDNGEIVIMENESHRERQAVH